MSRDLRLLSIDGGGVRGLSSLMILQQIMRTVNPENPPKPCDYFDMIGGTSTGGLNAVMLGRLRMTIEETIDAYLSLSHRVFEKKSHRISITGKIQGRFDTGALKDAVKQILVRQGFSEDELLKDDPNAPCKVFVCATSKETRDTVCLTSYTPVRGGIHLYNSTKIWEACRATSAATSFFDPIVIGPYGEEFIDGALGANNPIDALWSQAHDVYKQPWKVGCIVSIGTGKPTLAPFPDDLRDIGHALIKIATETESTAERFHRHNVELDEAGRLYRFNVEQGLEHVGLEESKRKNEIAAATRRYIEMQHVYKQIKACAAKLIPEIPQSVSQDLLPAPPVAASTHPLIQANPGIMGTPFGQALSAAGQSTPLHKACSKGKEQLVLSILENSTADLEAKDQDFMTPLQVAVDKNRLNVVKILLGYGADVDAHYRMWVKAKHPVFLAIFNNSLDMVKLLLDSGADIDETDIMGMTPLCKAASEGLFQIVTLILAKGDADLETRDRTGGTALWAAARKGHTTIVRELLEHGASVNAGPQRASVLESPLLKPEIRQLLQ